jgi:hypothetical protein
MNSPIIQNQVMMYILIADIDRVAKTYAVICDQIFITHQSARSSNQLPIEPGPLEEHRAPLVCGWRRVAY